MSLNASTLSDIEVSFIDSLQPNKPKTAYEIERNKLVIDIAKEFSDLASNMKNLNRDLAATNEIGEGFDKISGVWLNFVYDIAPQYSSKTSASTD